MPGFMLRMILLGAIAASFAAVPSRAQDSENLFN
jgi:hypothetical protein